ncbi:MAG: TrkH family potassium uptake protein [Peptococcaceae bacterium]|nr:TrkH family potassium uptake protein [Peptococcaceae bacterium]
MNIRMLFSVLGRFLALFGAAMAAPVFVAIIYKEIEALVFGACAVVFVLIGLVLVRKGSAEGKMSVKEAYLVVAGTWIVACVLGTAPFMLTGTIPNFVDALFESAAGFTTTGTSVLSDLESLPRSVLFWRSLSNWVGGMGVIMMFILLLPNMGIGAVNLYNTEVADFMPQKIMPKIKDKVSLLWKFYLGFTVVVAIALLVAGMPVYDAVNHALTSVCTGGFSVASQGIAGYNSVAVEIVLMVAMLVGGVNFTLLVALLHRSSRASRGRRELVFRDIELRTYFLLVLAAAVLIGTNLVLASGMGIGEAARQASFHAVSFTSSTAYSLSDYESWPGFAKIILLILMAIGGCSSSTAGGMKASRALVLGKMAVAFVKKSIHPKQVQSIELGGNTLSESLQGAISQFFFLFIGIFVSATLLISAMGYEPFTAMGAAMAALGNTGSSFGALGPAAGYSAVSAGVKIVLSFCMLFGRLEIIPLLVLFSPEFWRRRTW